MLSKIIQLSLRSAFHSAELSRTIGLRSTVKCRYSKFASRRPVSIVNEEELFDAKDTQADVRQAPKRPKLRRRKPKVKEEQIEKGVVNKGKTYIALKEDDKLISSLMIDIKTKKKREESNQMLLEGVRLIEDALLAGVKPKAIFFNRLSDILSLSLPKGVKLYKIPYRTIQLWSNLTASPGIIGIFDIPDVKAKQPANDAIPLTIICDNIREPGNLGTIVRIAAGVGCERLFLMKGCVDLWEPKVLRSAVGAHFRLPIFTSLSWEEIPMLINDDESAILIADNNITYNKETENDKVDLESDANTFINASNIDVEMNDSDTNTYHDSKNDEINQLLAKPIKSTAETKSLVKEIVSQFPIVPYHALDFTKKETVLIIGGETEGISLQSLNLLRTRNCTRVNISLTNGIDSLNTASAVGIIAFEMKRQFIIRKINYE